MATPRPLSPHMQIYRPQMTSLMSISHRVTGLSLLVFAPVVSLFLFLLAFMPSGAGDVVGWVVVLGSNAWGAVVLFIVSLVAIWSLFFHLFNGLRYMLWSMGWGFGLTQAMISGWFVLIATSTASVIAMRSLLVAYGGW
ncbi:MAG: succinate dehydrogenase, cytochrome b556 subunit [Alphaproteobacteria bacterium GM202ARS2]|nr:succinate dehydrogenase, cytochrome b556 subunit [Alphaproteobacteria bacterium GM202ARS2]